MYATPYTDELLAIAHAGIDCKLDPQKIFTMVVNHAKTDDAERESRMNALRFLNSEGVILPFTPPSDEGYKPHSPFMFAATRKVWREKIASADPAP